MIALGEIAVIGGGCYGSFYTGQLERAAYEGVIDYQSLAIVDRDENCAVASLPPHTKRRLDITTWDDFLDRWLVASERAVGDVPDMIVPSPLMPHLMASWIMRRASARWPDREVAMVPAAAELGTPFDRLHPDGVRYVSHADWLCPTHCVEPGLCPATRAPRTWEMGDTVAEWTRTRATERPTAGPALFTCRHVAYGVGMYPASCAFEGLDALVALADAGDAADLVVGSVSACHGAVGVIRVAAATG